MRFVIAGLGWWGRSWTDVLKIHPDARLIATVDPSTGARDWSRENLAVAHFSDLDSVGSEARMFWRGEQDIEIKSRYHPVISIERPDGSLERIPFEESIGDRRVPVLDHFIESITLRWILIHGVSTGFFEFFLSITARKQSHAESTSAPRREQVPDAVSNNDAIGD
jgi:hypothetical protein